MRYPRPIGSLIRLARLAHFTKTSGPMSGPPGADLNEGMGSKGRLARFMRTLLY
jgi:hypothetical protein